jgi:3-hydroxyisobutyrate dehydrogenase-like beta-hydroxyacid dehydrogenase
MTEQLTIGVLSPGAMGSALGRAWQCAGARVVTTVAGRSARTRTLADGLEILDSVAEVVAASQVVVSVVAPEAAPDVARTVATASRETGRPVVLADLNAIAPSTAAAIGAELATAGCELLDGSISGGPPRPGGSTRLYLSGNSAGLLAGLDAPGVIVHDLGAAGTAASAVKMCTASVYKGFTGLLLQALRTAHTHGVLDIVLDDLSQDYPDLPASAAVQLALAAAKSDRYPGEMRQIALTQAEAGAGPSLFLAFAEVYEALNKTRLARHSPEQAAELDDLDTVLAELTG